MKLTLLGTGGGAGWPHPSCTCASCESAYAEGEIRSHTSMLVDDVMLIDCGLDTPRSAVRLGVRLHNVRYLLVTHDHHDHANGAFLLWRRWADRTEPLDVLGPRSALDALAMWLPPTDPGVTFRPLEAGDVLALDTYTVTALAAEHDSDGALLFDVRENLSKQRFLYATDTGPAFEVPSDARYDLLLLEESWGDDTTHASGRHHDLVSFPATLARLHRTGAIDADSRVVAIHLGHGNPAPSQLRHRLAEWGAELPIDGEVIELGATGAKTAALQPKPARTLVLGGARSGKSLAAERLLANEPRVVYVATATDDPDDAEWARRIATHRARRPAHWSTVETSDLATVLRQHGRADPPLLIDCLTVWLARVIDDVGLWSARDDVAEKAAEVALAATVDDVIAALRTTSARVVAVSNDVGGGIVPDHRSGRRFRDELGTLNARVAAVCERVLFVTAGISTELRGSVQQ